MRVSAFRTAPCAPIFATALTLCASASAATGTAPPGQRADPQAVVLADEQARMDIIARLAPAVVCLLDEDRSGGGSGVVISPAGYGLTNFHVVAGMLKTRRGLGGLPDGRTYDLKVLGIDPTGDLAMFRLSGKDRFDFVELGDSDTLRTGDWVLAMGNPFLLAEDYKPTVTLGIVSGLHRYQWGADGNQLVYTDCIQIDASINPGNSGGPLFDLHGRLIGINGRAAFEERGRVNVGLAFAISINQIKRFLPALQAGRLVEHASLGATVADAGYHNVVFDRVPEDSPAARSGIREGDRLHAFAGQPIHNANQFANILGALPAGWTVDIETSRPPATDRIRARVTLGRLPVKPPRALAAATDVAEEAAPAGAQASAPATERPADAPAAEPPPPPNAFAKAIAVASPAVVKLYGVGVATEHGYGSGILISGDGRVVTTSSLLLESQNIRAVTSDGRLYRAEVQYRDPLRQLALLRLHAGAEPDAGPSPTDEQATPPRFTPLRPGSSKALRPGDWVLALGNPFKVAEGEEPVSAMRGVFSVRTPLDARHRVQDFPYRGEVLIVDAVTGNPGSAGGALVDLDGNWVGLIGKALWSNLTNTRLNYAIPIEEVAAFLSDAAAGRPAQPVAGTGPRPKGYHGIRLFPLAYRHGLPFVDGVDLGSPAERAGVRKEDLILSVNGVPIANTRAFQRACDALAAGDDLALVVRRGETLLTITMKLEKAPE